MIVTIADSIATITMTTEELGTLRYALSVGVDKLIYTASYLKAMQVYEAANAITTANDAKNICDALEAAVTATKPT
jgi:hypothetical protein